MCINISAQAYRFCYVLIVHLSPKYHLYSSLRWLFSRMCEIKKKQEKSNIPICNCHEFWDIFHVLCETIMGLRAAVTC